MVKTEVNNPKKCLVLIYSLFLLTYLWRSVNNGLRPQLLALGRETPDIVVTDPGANPMKTSEQIFVTTLTIEAAVNILALPSLLTWKL